MYILLIFPRIEHGLTTYRDKGSWNLFLYGYPAITLPHLAAITPKEHTVEITNENYDDINFDKDVDLVGITCLTMTSKRVYEIADEFRKRGKKVVLGGYHPSALPNEAKQHADAVVIGEAENVWFQLLKDVESSNLKPFYKSDEEVDMAAIPPIRRDLIKHLPLAGGVQSTRGCPHRCEFCAITSFYNHGMKQRPVKNVVDEIREMSNKFFILHDPSLTANPKYARELFKELIRQKVHKGWMACGNANVLAQIDEEFLDLARKSGFIEWFVGFESVNQEALNSISKSCNKVEDFKKMIKRVHDHGMTVQGGIIFGFDQDASDVFDTTAETIDDWDLDILETYILTPLPGTPLFDRLDREGRLLTKDWTKYNLVNVVFQPKNMSPDELFEGTRGFVKEFYTYPKTLGRSARIMMRAKSFAGIIPTGTNISFRRYYKRDYGF